MTSVHVPVRSAFVTDMQPVLRAEALVVARGGRTLLSDVDLVLRAGDAVCVEGPNGSGKTTLLRVLVGLATPRAGRIARASRCAFVPEKVALSPAMRCGEWLTAMRGLRGLGGLDWPEAARSSGLSDRVLEAPCATLSKGMLQRIALLESLHGGCALLVADEPFSGLDASGREWLARALRACVATGTSVLVSDHSGSARSMLHLTARLRLEDGRCLSADSAQEGILTIVASHDGDGRVERRVAEQDSDALLRNLLAEGWHIHEVRG